MSETDGVTVQLEEAAGAAELMAHWWSRPIDEERASWAQLGGHAAEIVAGIGLDADAAEWAAGIATTREEGMLEEYERLFVGPGRTPCAPYESLWRADAPRRERGLLMGPATIEVQALCREMGLTMRAEVHELPDHVVVEWEALAFALAEGRLEPGRRLLVEHLAIWLPELCDAIVRETSSPFYSELAARTPSWVRALGSSLELAVAG